MILRKIAGSRYSEILPAWQGLAVVVIGCGPSLSLGDVEYVRRARQDGGIRVIAINDAFLWAPWADLSYAADSKWHGWMQRGIAKPRLGLTADAVRDLWCHFAGVKCSTELGSRRSTAPTTHVAGPEVHIVRNRDSDKHGMGLSTDPQTLATGRNSGAQAVNLAILAGASRIVLVGFDGEARDGETHFHGGHADGVPDAVWPYIRESFAAIAKELPKGVRVLNCSRNSAIDAFPRATLGEALEMACA